MGSAIPHNCYNLNDSLSYRSVTKCMSTCENVFFRCTSLGYCAVAAKRIKLIGNLMNNVLSGIKLSTSLQFKMFVTYKAGDD